MIALEKRERAREILADAFARYSDRIALACSFGGPTGMVILDLALAIEPKLPVYFLDTGLLFDETYDLVERVRERYGIDPIAVRSQFSVEEQNKLFGDALWMRDPDACCDLRKVRPQRAFLANYDAWITGLRRDQTSTRVDVEFFQTDDEGRMKIAPLADWDERDVWKYILERNVPYNALNDRGYPSVGCTHCTRAIVQGEDVRAGRWSGFAKTECGLHLPTRKP